MPREDRLRHSLATYVQNLVSLNQSNREERLFIYPVARQRSRLCMLVPTCTQTQPTYENRLAIVVIDKRFLTPTSA